MAKGTRKVPRVDDATREKVLGPATLVPHGVHIDDWASVITGLGQSSASTSPGLLLGLPPDRSARRADHVARG